MRVDTSNRARHTAGYSLVEVLVVIAILGVLASITYPISLKVQANVQSTQAKSVADQTVSACEQFFNEYHYYPPKNGNFSNIHDDTFFSLENKSVMFIASLTGKDSIHNTKSKSYLTLVQAKNNLTNGFYRNDKGVPSGILDPWGKGYAIVIDYNYDGKIHIARYGIDLRQPIAVFSAGPDGEWDTVDDIKSWR